MDKQTARMIAQQRIDAFPQDSSDESIIKGVEALLKRVVTQPGLVRVLTYNPEQQWREIDPTSLIGMFPNFQFTTAPVSESEPQPNGQFDAALVPLYGFNERGFRLGHGGGWYDRFLARQEHIVKIGIGREIGKVDFHTEMHDIKMDYIITEKGVILL